MVVSWARPHRICTVRASMVQPTSSTRTRASVVNNRGGESNTIIRSLYRFAISRSKFVIASLASISVARTWGVPLGKILSFSIFVFSNMLDKSAESFSNKSSRPGPAGKPRTRSTEGRATSASTSITVLSSSAAMLIAKFIAVKLLPSPGTALVTMIKLPFSISVAPFPLAFLMRGRLMTRYWSAI